MPRTDGGRMAAGFFSGNVCVAMHQLRIDRRSPHRTKPAHSNGRTIVIGTSGSVAVSARTAGQRLPNALSRQGTGLEGEVGPEHGVI